MATRVIGCAPKHFKSTLAFFSYATNSWLSLSTPKSEKWCHDLYSPAKPNQWRRANSVGLEHRPVGIAHLAQDSHSLSWKNRDLLLTLFYLATNHVNNDNPFDLFIFFSIFFIQFSDFSVQISVKRLKIKKIYEFKYIFLLHNFFLSKFKPLKATMYSKEYTIVK